VIVTTAVRSAASAARETLRVVTAVGSHAMWWLDYRVGGRTRNAPRDGRP
jgi:hypothetical protein